MKVLYCLDLYDSIDTQTKTALTRYYNSCGLKSSTVAPQLAGMKKGKKASVSRGDDDDEEGLYGEEGDGEAIEEEAPEEEEEEDIEALRAQLAKGKGGKGGGTSGTGKASTKAAKGESKAETKASKKK